MLTIENGGITIPVFNVSETYDEIAQNTTFYLPLDGLSVAGSILVLNEPNWGDTGYISYCPVKNSQGEQVFPTITDIKYRVETTQAGQYIVYLSRHMQQGDELHQICDIYGTSQNPKLNIQIIGIVKTSDDKYVWGLSGVYGLDPITDIITYPDNSAFGFYSFTVPEDTDLSITNDRVSQAAQDMLAEMLAIAKDISDDPYSLGGYSAVGGGQGTFSGVGGHVGFSALPTLSAVATGFITLYNPTAAQMASLSSYMWDSNLFDMNTWQKLWADPMDAILGLSIVPVEVPNGGTVTVKVGNISTGVSMTRAASQYVTVDCGSVLVRESFGGYLDYDPYTKIDLYLPYIGTHALSADEVMGKNIHVIYHVDILSGGCIAEIAADGEVLYNFIGQCSASIPVSGADMTQVINGIISASVSVGSMVATGGASAPMALPSLASTAVNSMKPSIEKSGGLSGMGGMLGIQTPYLIISRPRMARPEEQNKFTGYPSFITETLGNLKGYTEIEMCHLENIPATDSELSEIENLLKSGVIF